MSDDNYSSDDMDEQYEIAFAAGAASRNDEIARLETEFQQAKQVAAFWKAEHVSGNEQIDELIDELRAKATALEAENAEWKERAGQWCEAYCKTVNRKENITSALGVAILIIIGMGSAWIMGW